MRAYLLILLLVAVAFSGVMGPSNSAFNDKDMFNPELLKIDEKKHLGNFIPDVKVVLENGEEKSIYTFIKEKPTILLLSYYTCQGTCPVRVDSLNRLIKKSSLKNREFYVLVLSFDKLDSLETLKRFKKVHGPFTKHWIFGLINKEDIEKLTNSVGFKFFFVERDKTFVHPNVYIFISPEGRITRYLYGVKPSERDIRIALAETEQDRISLNSVVDLAYLVCFTYDPSRSRYVVNPTLIFGGIGFAVLGTVILFTFISNKLAKREV
ncbi:MAG: SCO family protein [Aquifex sp.]|nr:MAG: SCO family protein [Aquifex sp.]